MLYKANRSVLRRVYGLGGVMIYLFKAMFLKTFKIKENTIL